MSSELEGGVAENILMIVPLSYGYIHSRNVLPAVEERVLEAAARHYFEHSSVERRIVMGYAVKCPMEIPKKVRRLLDLGVQEKHILTSSVPLKNTITEGETIKDVVVAANLTAGAIILIAHEDCATRARYIFSELFPGAKILVEKIGGDFEKDIPYKLMRNRSVHKTLNLIYYWGMKILGLEHMRRYGHPEHEK